MSGKRSNEFIAIWLVGGAVVLAAFLIWAIIAESTLAWLVFVGVTALVIVLLVLGWSRGQRVRQVPVAPPAPNDGFYRVLVVVDDGATSAAFNEELVRSAGGRPSKAFVVAPALSSKLDRITGDQAAYDQAEAHLNATLQALDALGVDATGRIGSHDPLQAAIDALREFPADAIILATHANEHSNWLEDGLVESVGRVTRAPVSHVTVD
jgi:hypothetical protein